jgi:hypothetical protein
MFGNRNRSRFRVHSLIFTVAHSNDSATFQFAVSLRGSAGGKCRRTGVRASVDGADTVDGVDRVDATTAPTANGER